MTPNKESTSWRRSRKILILACVVFPPAAVVLVWSRPESGVFRKLAFSLGLAVLFVVHLFAFYGLRAELDGTGMSPIFSFHNPQSHYEAIEKRGGATGATSVQTAVQGAVQAASARQSSAYWTDYRGPGRDGSYEQTPIRTDWPAAGLRKSGARKWAAVTLRSSSPGAACSPSSSGEARKCSPVTTSTTALRFGPIVGGELSGADGRSRPRATPTWHDGTVYALGGEGELRAVEAATGETLWRRNVFDDTGARNLTWAMAGSPLIVGGKVIVLPGGPNGKSIAAYDTLSGEPVWTSLDDQQAYTSPMEVTLAGRRQIVLVSAPRMLAIDAEDGRLLWDYPWKTSYDVNCAQPLIVDEHHVFVSSGYGHGAALVKITREGEQFRAGEVWKNLSMKNKFNSSVLRDGYVYGLDEAILACVNARTGKRA